MKLNVRVMGLEAYRDDIEISIDELGDAYKPGGKFNLLEGERIRSVAINKFMDALRDALREAGFSVGEKQVGFFVWEAASDEQR
jgi:hypothetical protein